MKIELPVRWLSNKEDKETREKKRLARLINKDEEEDEEVVHKFEYHQLILDTNDVKSIAEYDADHTTIGLFGGDFYVVRTTFPVFKAFYEFCAGQTIKNIDSFAFSKD